MKLSGIIFAFLYIQVSSSFLDDFRSAITNVERGFGKLLTDVVSDVKDTIHCTISAVEQVLVLNGLLDQSSSYSYSCRGARKPIPKPASPPKIRDQRSLLDDFHRLKYSNHALDYGKSPRLISMELEKSIANVNKTINDILGHHHTNSNLKVMSKTMKQETDRLTEISNILKRELEKISSNIRLEIRTLLFDRQESNIETIWDEINILHDIQHKSRNNTEVKEIRNVLDKVVNKLNLKSDNSKVNGVYNLKEIRKTLQTYSDSNNKHMNDNDNRLKPQLPSKKPNIMNTSKSFKDIANKIFNQEKKSKKTNNTSHSGTSLFNSGFNPFAYFTPFSTKDDNSKKTISDANKIIEDSQHTDKILNNFFNEHRAGPNVFSNPELLNFNKS